MFVFLGPPQLLFDEAAAIDIAPQADVEHGDQGADRGQQKHRRDGKLDNARDVGEMRFHGGRGNTSPMCNLRRTRGLFNGS